MEFACEQLRLGRPACRFFAKQQAERAKINLTCHIVVDQIVADLSKAMNLRTVCWMPR
jgi:hypothetical protein